MNNIVKEELSKVRVANLSNYDENSNSYYIPMYKEFKYQLNRVYIVRVNNIIVNNNDNILAVNWNNGTSPISNYLKIFVSKINGNMIFVDSLVYNNIDNVDTDIVWSGWLPTENLSLVKEV